MIPNKQDKKFNEILKDKTEKLIKITKKLYRFIIFPSCNEFWPPNN